MLPPGNNSILKKHLIEHSSQGLIPISEPLETYIIGSLKEAFEPYNSEGDALDEIKALRIRDMLIDKHIAKYKMLIVMIFIPSHTLFL